MTPGLVRAAAAGISADAQARVPAGPAPRGSRSPVKTTGGRDQPYGWVMRAVVLCVVFLALPSSAHAATLVKSGSTLTYTAAAGRANTVTFSVPDPGQPGSVRVARAGDGDPIQATGCAPGRPGLHVHGHRADRRRPRRRHDPSTRARSAGTVAIDGGPGADQLYGGAAADTLDGGEGDDVLDGGAGNDTIERRRGRRRAQRRHRRGRAQRRGRDRRRHCTCARRRAAPRASRSTASANDGAPGRGRQLRVRHRGRVDPRPGRHGRRRSASTLIGSAAGNELVTGTRQRHDQRRRRQRHASTAVAGDDTIDVRDGYATACAAARARTRWSPTRST